MIEKAIAKPKIEPLLLTAGQAAISLGISRSFFYLISSNGVLGPTAIKLGSKKLWSRKELQSWVEAGCDGRDDWLDKKNN